MKLPASWKNPIMRSLICHFYVHAWMPVFVCVRKAKNEWRLGHGFLPKGRRRTEFSMWSNLWRPFVASACFHGYIDHRCLHNLFVSGTRVMCVCASPSLVYQIRGLRHDNDHPVMHDPFIMHLFAHKNILCFLSEQAKVMIHYWETQSTAIRMPLASFNY